MKKMFFFAAMASVAFASCTTDEKVFDGTDESNEIRFAVAQYSPQSRAEHDEGAAFNENVTIWSWYDGNAETVIDADVWNKTTYSTTGFMSNYKYYWPVDDKSLDFVAVPTSLVGTPYFTAPTRDASGATELVFKIASGTDYHSTNLMATEVLTGNRTTGTVALLFRHLLSKVNIKVSQKERANTDARWTVTINDLDITGLKCTGSVEIDDAWNAKNDGLPRFWDTVGGSETWNVNTSAHSLYASGDESAAKTDFTSAETFYMLPQTLEDGVQQITIQYTVVTDYLGNPTQPNTTETYTKTFDLKGATAIAKWAMNKVITYNIAIDPSETLSQITFTVNEEEWGTESGSTPDVDPIP